MTRHSLSQGPRTWKSVRVGNRSPRPAVMVMDSPNAGVHCTAASQKSWAETDTDARTAHMRQSRSRLDMVGTISSRMHRNN